MIVAAPGFIGVVRMRVPTSIRRVVITGAANIMVVRVACAARYDHAIRRVTIVAPDEGCAQGAGEDKDNPFAAFQLATLFPECPKRLNICHSYTFASMKGAVNYNALPDLEWDTFLISICILTNPIPQTTASSAKHHSPD